jgi:hypothetical protein
MSFGESQTHAQEGFHGRERMQSKTMHQQSGNSVEADTQARSRKEYNYP